MQHRNWRPLPEPPVTAKQGEVEKFYAELDAATDQARANSAYHQEGQELEAEEVQAALERMDLVTHVPVPAGEWREFVPSGSNRVQAGDEYRNLRIKRPFDETQWHPVSDAQIGWDSWVFAGDEFRRWHPATEPDPLQFTQEERDQIGAANRVE